MAKLDSDDIPMNFTSLDLSEVVRETLIDFLPTINNEKIQLKVNLIDKAIIYGDKLSMVRIISNLINNSLKYGKDGNLLGIELLSSDKYYTLNIYDKGKGIPKEHINYIFNRLYTGDESRRTSTYNSGLGLSIVKKLTQLHNGEIFVESIPFEKTTFTFKIPKL